MLRRVGNWARSAARPTRYTAAKQQKVRFAAGAQFARFRRHGVSGRADLACFFLLVVGRRIIGHQNARFSQIVRIELDMSKSKVETTSDVFKSDKMKFFLVAYLFCSGHIGCMHLNICKLLPAPYYIRIQSVGTGTLVSYNILQFYI